MDSSIPVHVIVDSIPTDIFSSGLQALSGIVLPLIVLYISFRIGKSTERRAKAYTDQLRVEDDLKTTIQRAHAVLDQLYLCTIRICFNNYKKALIDQNTKQLIEANTNVLESKSSLAKLLSHWNMTRQLDLIDGRDKEFEITRMEIDQVRANIQRLFKEVFLQDLLSALDVMLKDSNKAGTITEEMKNDVINEMNKLEDLLEKDPRNCLKDKHN